MCGSSGDNINSYDCSYQPQAEMQYDPYIGPSGSGVGDKG